MEFCLYQYFKSEFMPYQMTDVDLMPFWVHKGTKMIDVPAEYLIWLYENDRCSPNVKAYIEDAMDFLNKEIELKKNMRND